MFNNVVLIIIVLFVAILAGYYHRHVFFSNNDVQTLIAAQKYQQAVDVLISFDKNNDDNELLAKLYDHLGNVTAAEQICKLKTHESKWCLEFLFYNAISTQRADVAAAEELLQLGLKHNVGKKEHWIRLQQALSTWKEQGSEQQILQPIDRRSSLSLREFFSEYAEKKKPVILTNMTSLGVFHWELELLKAECGNMTVQAKPVDPDRRGWGGLGLPNKMTLKRFIDGLEENTTRHLYVHDHALPSLATGCRKLLSNVRIPMYFAHDFLQRIPLAREKKKDNKDGQDDTIYHYYSGVPHQNSWPSLFIGTEKVRSLLHIDTMCTHFWMALIKGHKRWTFYNQDDVPLLRFQTSFSQYPSTQFHSDATDIPKSLLKSPFFSQARGYTSILNPGEVIYVPAGSPHQVENLDTTIAISGNYIDNINLNNHLNELHEECPGANDPNSECGYLAHHFEHKDFDKSIDYSLEDHVLFADFKANIPKYTKKWYRKHNAQTDSTTHKNI